MVDITERRRAMCNSSQHACIGRPSYQLKLGANNHSYIFLNVDSSKIWLIDLRHIKISFAYQHETMAYWESYVIFHPASRVIINYYLTYPSIIIRMFQGWLIEWA